MARRNYRLLIRIHQALIMVLMVFSLFVKPEVKRVFWIIIGGMMLSLFIQMFFYGFRPGAFGNKNENEG